MYCWSVAKKSQIGNKVESSLPKEIQLRFQKNQVTKQIYLINVHNGSLKWNKISSRS